MNLSKSDQSTLIEFCRENEITMVGLFGSCSRNEESENSDIDLLVRFSRPISLLKMVRLERELTEKLGQPVDLLTESAISPYLRDRILNDLQVIYEEG